jgi:hypothetical protein
MVLKNERLKESKPYETAKSPTQLAINNKRAGRTTYRASDHRFPPASQIEVRGIRKKLTVIVFTVVFEGN